MLGPEPANTLMEHLPPVGWGDVATKRDLDDLGAAMRREMDARFDLVDAEFRIVREQMSAMQHKIIGTMHTEFIAQSKAMFLAIVSIVLTMAGLTFGLVFSLAR